MRGGNEEDAKHDTCEVTQVKHIVRFAWGWKEFLDYGFVNVHRGLDKNLLKETYVGKFLKVASKAKKLLNYYRFLDTIAAGLFTLSGEVSKSFQGIQFCFVAIQKQG